MLSLLFAKWQNIQKTYMQNIKSEIFLSYTCLNKILYVLLRSLWLGSLVE